MTSRPTRIGRNTTLARHAFHRFRTRLEIQPRRLFRGAGSGRFRRGHHASAREQREVPDGAFPHARLPHGHDFRSGRQHDLHPQAESMNLKEKQPCDSASAELEQSAQFCERVEVAIQLLSNIKQQLPKLEELLAEVESHWGIEDGFYRFYHQSFKVYQVQQTTEEICETLQNLLPNRP